MAKLSKQVWGTLEDGSQVVLYRLTLKDGSYVDLSNLGARLVSCVMPDRQGKLDNCVQGYPELSDYLKDGKNHGATCGRYANRLAAAAITLDGKQYQLEANEGPNTLHGGFAGYNLHLWDCRAEDEKVVFSLFSPDGEGGFPGNLEVRTTYTLSEDHRLTIHEEADTDQATVVNLTNHSYFNIGGDSCPNVLGQRLTISADFTTEVDAALIPTGAILPVKGGCFDFNQGKLIGQDIKASNQQLSFGKGYDHNFVLRKTERGQLEQAAQIYDPASGRELTCLTTKPGLQIYSANHISGLPYRSAAQTQSGLHTAICLETQNFPNAAAITWFPDPILRPGQHYAQTTVYAFSART
ncbi:MAG: galactose mutarotase [Oscillospiraceae bacterium]|nr:galactose mutarotase [Oscillospiraceae bacterium]